MAYLTDKEKRLLFSALSREKEVCKQVDKEFCREPYEQSLESVVKSLERKFYYDRFEKEIRATAIEEFAEKLKYELNGNIIPDNEKFTYARKQQEQICHQNMTLKRAIKYVDYIAEQLKGGAE